jgi:uncharacterized protein HemY
MYNEQHIDTKNTKLEYSLLSVILFLIAVLIVCILIR